jgi:hypothetical protein
VGRAEDDNGRWPMRAFGEITMKRDLFDAADPYLDEIAELLDGVLHLLQGVVAGRGSPAPSNGSAATWTCS